MTNSLYFDFKNTFIFGFSDWSPLPFGLVQWCYWMKALVLGYFTSFCQNKAHFQWLFITPCFFARYQELVDALFLHLKWKWMMKTSVMPKLWKWCVCTQANKIVRLRCLWLIAVTFRCVKSPLHLNHDDKNPLPKANTLSNRHTNSLCGLLHIP